MVTEAMIREWCLAYLTGPLNLPAKRVGPDVKFARMGLDSAMAVSLLAELEEKLGREIPPDSVFEHQTVNALARYLSATVGAP